jgi:hypothetical protein
MVTQLPSTPQQDIIYPDSDGQPMADNTKQFELIVLIKKNLDLLFTMTLMCLSLATYSGIPLKATTKPELPPMSW